MVITFVTTTRAEALIRQAYYPRKKSETPMQEISAPTTAFHVIFWWNSQ